MEEKKTTLEVPDAYRPLLEDIRLLKSDENNPNRMSIKQHDEVWKSLQKYGWTYPIIVNKEGVYCDGEQRADVCKKHDEFWAPVLRLLVSDVDRRMLRQILNKLKGKHNKELDAAEYMRIIEKGEKDSLKALLMSIGERLPQELLERELTVTIPATYEIIVECKDESNQKSIFEKLKSEGYKLRILTL
jgi:hypothetical protein